MAAIEYISLSIARQHLRVGDDTSLDTLIEYQLEAAFDTADAFTNRTLRSDYTSANMPAAVKQAILLILGTYFDNPSDEIVGRSVSQLSLTAEKILSLYRKPPYGETTEDDELCLTAES